MCETCGISYADFRTGLSYQDVFGMLWVADPDPQTWRQKRRASVLGFWHELKLGMWREHLELCRPFEVLAHSPLDYLEVDR